MAAINDPIGQVVENLAKWGAELEAQNEAFREILDRFTVMPVSSLADWEMMKYFQREMEAVLANNPPSD